MKTFLKRVLVLSIALVMCISLLPLTQFKASAKDVDYVTSGKYIYNWGERGETATFLSQNAEAFYTGTNTYANFATLSGGTGKDNAPSSALYKALKDYMSAKHTHITEYQETRDLYKYTDCENSGGKISSFYSGTSIGPAWDGGSTWNREHTWPNSKGEGNAENDIMMLRPTSVSENSNRGDTAYGKSSGYYNPNSTSGGNYDLRGDVARIVLYVYVRWGNTSRMWGSSGVMESLDVLLEWMEADPVDTWELGRNDSVQSITGTRNVFVDYPELAFLLFGRDIPANMSTPSGNSKEACDHNNFDAGKTVAPTCTSKGYTLYTCKTTGCTYSYKTNEVSATGHNYVSGTCTNCGGAEYIEPQPIDYAKTLTVGTAYKFGFFSTNNGAEYYFIGAMNGYYGDTSTVKDDGVDTYVESTTGGYYLYFVNNSGQKQYINLVYTGTHYNFTFANTASTVYTWDTEKHTLKTTLNGEVSYMGTYGSYTTFSVLITSKISTNDYFAHFYPVNGSTTTDPSDPSDPQPEPCTHNYTSLVTAPTCSKDGYTTYTCTICGDSYKANTVSAYGHIYQNNACISCGAVKASNTEEELSFADKNNRVSFSTTQQIWEFNGVIVTNDKASASSNVGDYANPARFYQGSNVTISYPGMTKIVIDCSGLESKYVSTWLNVTNGTAVNNNNIITITFATPVDELVYTSLAKQSRAYSITVFAEGAPADCTHTQTTVTGAYAATCDTEGHTGMTICATCKDLLDAGTVIPATGHKLGDWTVVTPPTCKEAGTSHRECENCNYFESKEEQKTSHTDAQNDGVCDSCGTTIDTDAPSGGNGEGTTKPSTPNIPSEPSNPGQATNPGSAILILAAIGLGALIIAFVTFKKKIR